MTAEQKLQQLGYQLSTPAAPAANYISVNRSGNHLYVSGQISADFNGVFTGILGKDLTKEDGQKAAAMCAVNILSQVANTAGVPLNQIKKLLKLTVLVASAPTFTDQHIVANGASDLFVEVLGEAGRHARAAFGVASLPLGAAVEIEAIVEV